MPEATSPSPLRLRMPAQILRRARQRLFPPDPGAIRFHDAASATLSGLVTFAATLALARFIPLPAGIEVFGFAASVFVAVSVHDEGTAAQRLTTLLTVLPMALMLLATSLLIDHPAILDALLVGLIACALYAPVIGPRWAALATVAVTSELFGVVTRPPLSEIEERLAILVVAVGGAYLVRFWIWPLPQADIARRVWNGIAARIVAMLIPVSEAVRTGAFTPELRRQASEAVALLEEAMTIAQARLGPSASTRPLANHLLDLEFAAERVVRAALHGLPQAGPDRDAALVGLAVLRVGLVAGKRARLPEPAVSADHVVTQIGYLLRVAGRRAVDAAAAPVPQVPAVDAATRRTLLGQAIQAAVAVAAAIVAGHLISSTRWYWAAFTTFLVFQGVRSRQETALKAWQIAIGTVGGVVAGVLLATALAGHAYAAATLSIVALFLAFYASTAAYGVSIFWITIIIGLVFGMLGFFPPELLALRLEETLLGVACGVGAAFLFRFDRAPDRLAAARGMVLADLGALVSAAGHRIAGGGMTGDGSDAGTDALVATMQRSVLAYAAIALPRLRGLPTMWNQGTRRSLTRLRACSHWAQDLAALAAEGPPEADAATAALLAAETDRVLALIAAARRADGGDTPSPQVPQLSGTTRFAPPGASARGHQAFRLLLAIEGVLRRGQAGLTSVEDADPELVGTA